MTFSQAEIQAIVLSLKASGISLLIQTPFALWFGYLVARKQFKGKILIESLINLPQVLPPVVTGFLLLLILGRDGFLGSFLFQALGIRIAFSFGAVIIASSLVSFPIYLGFVKSAIIMVDAGLEDAGRTLGRGNLYVFFTITFPLALPGILNGFILAFARNLGEFGATITFAGNISGLTRTIPLAIYNAMQTPGAELITMRLVLVSVLISISVMMLSGFLKKKMTII
ncbi:MAG: molybdate ABC transporter permease subunit [Salinivirgaceae bacterium]|jgi:molybdate transport system permease protein|nr:molybdate ABC transporter permease subunit [Salinivirgaceae bacterium]